MCSSEAGGLGREPTRDCTLFFDLASERLVMQRVPAAVLHPFLFFIAWQCVNCDADYSHIFGCEHHKVRILFFSDDAPPLRRSSLFSLYQYQLGRLKSGIAGNGCYP